MTKVAGVLFFLAGTTLVIGILLAEILYPARYSISQNMISTLAASPPPHSVIHQPSATVFDHAMSISGMLLMSASFVLFRLYRRSIFIISTFLLGMGTLGVGLFPAFHAHVHPLVALTAFLFGGIAAITSFNMSRFPLSILSVFLGSVSLFFLFLGTILPHVVVPVFGAGGTERMVLYPLVLWLVGFGGYLMNSFTVLRLPKRERGNNPAKK
ncbi:MAG: DUF998 domain-containing protein [Patescibacteria group bacterium]